MANKGVDDIADFEDKVRFALLALPPAEASRIVGEEFGGSLTPVTLETWKTGRNKPSRAKLDLFCRALGVRVEDFYEDFSGFADIVSAARNISRLDRERFARRLKERGQGDLRLDVANRRDRESLRRLFRKIGGRYILYNYSMNNVSEINRALVCVEGAAHPFIRLSAVSVRDRDHATSYQGWLFPVRSNLCLIMETRASHHDEVVMILTNNPEHQGGRVRFLYGMILSGSEDFVSHPSAARVFLEKLPDDVTVERALERIREGGQDDVPQYCRTLINNDVSGKRGEFVLRAEQLNMSYALGLMDGKIKEER